MNAVRERFGWGFWLWWVAASAVGLIIGFGVYFPLVVGYASEQSLPLQTLLSAVGGAVLGAAIGLAQWLVLRRSISQPGQWISASTAGGVVGGVAAIAVGVPLGAAAGFMVALVTGGALVGAALGAAQWLVLRRQVAGAGWWIFASAVALALGFALGRGVGGFLADVVGEALQVVVGTAAFGALLLGGYGGITGAVLVWLLRQPSAEQPGVSQAAA